MPALPLPIRALVDSKGGRKLWSQWWSLKKPKHGCLAKFCTNPAFQNHNRDWGHVQKLRAFRVKSGSSCSEVWSEKLILFIYMYIYVHPGLPQWLSSKENSPAMQETQEMWVWSLGGEDPLEEGSLRGHQTRIDWTGVSVLFICLIYLQYNMHFESTLLVILICFY